MARFLKFSIVAALFALAACTSSAGEKKPAASDAPAHAGRPAPDWTEPTTQGPALRFTSLHGKAAYLNFFATWCPPCNEEAPAIESLQREYGDRGLQVVGIDVLENARKAASFQHDHHLSYPVVVDDGTLRGLYAVNGLPVHVFIDRNGIVRNIVAGELSAQEMRRNVESVLR